MIRIIEAGKTINMEILKRGLQFIHETTGRLLKKGMSEDQSAAFVPDWKIRLHKMEEEGDPSEQRLLYLTSRLFDPGKSKEEYDMIYNNIGNIYRSLSRDDLEQSARDGDPNAIMELITKAGETNKGNQGAQRAEIEYYLKMGMRSLREKFISLEEFAHELGIDPYNSDEDSGQARMTE